MEIKIESNSSSTKTKEVTTQELAEFIKNFINIKNENIKKEIILLVKSLNMKN